MAPEFFERPAPIEDPGPRPPRPPWDGPPYGVLPGVVALEVVVAANERAAVSVGRCAAYATGFELDIRVLIAPGNGDLEPSMSGIHRRRGGDSYDEMLRFGLEFADGRRVTNVGGRGHRAEAPDGPVLSGMGGGGGGGRWRQEYWVWPLPPAGPLALVCEWPVAGIALTRVDVDARLLLDAAARARSLFPDETTGHSGGSWSSFGVTQSTARRGD